MHPTKPLCCLTQRVKSRRSRNYHKIGTEAAFILDHSVSSLGGVSCGSLSTGGLGNAETPFGCSDVRHISSVTPFRKCLLSSDRRYKHLV